MIVFFFPSMNTLTLNATQISDPHYLAVTPVANNSEINCSNSEGHYVCHRSDYYFLQCIILINLV